MQIDFRTVWPMDPKVIGLIDKLNAYQINLYGIEYCNLETPESLIANGALMIGGYDGNALVAIGAIKIFGNYAEVKRMFVESAYRGLGIAEKILLKLESMAAQKNITKIYLETGNRHSEALAFYKKMGYLRIDSFGDYKPNSVSIYFEKKAP